MKITDTHYMAAYEVALGSALPGLIKAFLASEHSGSLVYRTQVSAVYSSNIEGNTVDVNTFMNYKLSQVHIRPNRELEEIDDLISAYEFAQGHGLSEAALLESHRKLSNTLLIESQRGQYRQQPVGVFDRAGLVYLAIEPQYVQETMSTFFDDVQILLNQELSPAQVLYFAAQLHLKFAHIHPFMDGNGRVARLLEKWFVAEKLGSVFWKIPSEQYYKEHQPEYYQNIHLGVNYYELDDARRLPFLLMLPECLKIGR